MAKGVLKPFLVMISAAALLWCVAMAIHLANAKVPTSIVEFATCSRQLIKTQGSPCRAIGKGLPSIFKNSQLACMR